MSEVKNPVNCASDVGEGVNGVSKDLEGEGEKSYRGNMLGKWSPKSYPFMHPVLHAASCNSLLAIMWLLPYVA